MQVPYKLSAAFRTDTPPGLLLAISVSTAVFVATPISLPAVAERFGVSAGTVGLYSAAQLGMFVAGSWAAGRFASPSLRVFRISLALIVATNLASALTADFATLVAARAFTGLALGVITWLAWSQVFGDADRQGDMAAVGPLSMVAAAPVFGLLLEWGDVRHVFAALAAVSLAPLLTRPEIASRPPVASQRTKAVPQARVLVTVLAVMTLGGSAVFVYGGVIASERLGMSPLAVSLVYTLNAVVSIPSARWRGSRPHSGVWVILTAGCALLAGSTGSTWVFSGAVVIWGVFFWAGVPGLYSLLAERSAHPADRAGDAQAAMAAGRALGPLLGGALVSAGSFTVLGAVCGALVAASGMVALLVEHRARRDPPRPPAQQSRPDPQGERGSSA